jgi:hypothetical protein
VRVSRATFLESCGIALLGARVDFRALGSLALPHDGIEMKAVRSNRAEGAQQGGRFRLQDATDPLFLQHLNTSFSVRSADGTGARLVLAEVIERPVTKNVAQFSLIFHAPAGAAVRDGTHAVQHPSLGDFDLFIVPVGPSNLRRVYQACFSRHLGSRQASEPTRCEPRASEMSPRETRCGAGTRSAPPRWRT